MRLVLRVGRERAYFFYLDRGAYQAYEHRGRVVLVGARSGRVVRSRTIRFAPAIDGRLPKFLRSREGYDLPRYRVDFTDYSVAGAARAAGAGPGPFGGDGGVQGRCLARSVASQRLVASSLRPSGRARSRSAAIRARTA